MAFTEFNGIIVSPSVHLATVIGQPAWPPKNLANVTTLPEGVATHSMALMNGTSSLAGYFIVTTNGMAMRNNANDTTIWSITNTGAVTMAGGITVTTGDLTITAGNLIFGAASAKIIPGATSLLFRNNADSGTNITIADAGAVTIGRGSLTVTTGGITVTAGGITVTAGDVTITAGNLIFGAASANIVPGATSLLFRNNANAATNITITDAGAVTIARAGLTVTTGGITVTAGGLTVTAGDLTITATNLIFGAASGGIVPGATSFLFRNNANAATNITITDAGAVTIARAGLTVTTGGITATAGNIVATAGAILSASPTLGIGYSTGAGGAQTQSTNKGTTVVSNTITTLITMNNAALAAGTIVSFTFTNSAIAATDHILINHESGGTVGSYTFAATPAGGSATIFVRNATAGSLSEAIVIRVTVIKAVSA